MIDFRESEMSVALGIGVIALIWGLRRSSKDVNSPIHLYDLLIGDDGKISKAAAVMHGSFLATTWVVVFQTLNKTITDVTFGLYVATWCAPTITKLIKGPAPVTPVQTTQTTIMQSTKEVTTP